MQLSERGAIRSAIADGGFHLYPAGKLLDIISSSLAGDKLNGDFDPRSTLEKLDRVAIDGNSEAKQVFEQDMRLLKTRLSAMQPQYDIEGCFDKMMAAIPQMAKRYYGLENFEAPRPKIVEYFFEGYNELYKDGDWFAFNVNSHEAKEMNVPIGTYFKRSQVSPGHPEFTTLHEANHAMQDAAGIYPDFHHYVPWFDEGFADALGRMMLYRATNDESLLFKIKNFRTEVEVTDPRKITYHYDEEIAALTLMRGRLPFFKALLKARGKEPFAFDWSAYANNLKTGQDPHVALINSYTGGKKDAFIKRFEKDETAFRKEGDLDQKDLKVLSMFIAVQAPARIEAAEYNAALWLANAVREVPGPHFVDPAAIPADYKNKIANFTEGNIVPAASVPDEVWKKVAGLHTKVLVRESDIPENFKESIDALAAKYFVIKREIDGTIVFEPYGGALPYRLSYGELRCAY